MASGTIKTVLPLSGGTMIGNLYIHNTGESKVTMESGAGEIHVFSAASSTGSRGIWATNASGTDCAVLIIDQSNNVHLFGIADNVSGQSLSIASATTDATGNINTGLSKYSTTILCVYSNSSAYIFAPLGATSTGTWWLHVGANDGTVLANTTITNIVVIYSKR